MRPHRYQTMTLHSLPSPHRSGSSHRGSTSTAAKPIHPSLFRPPLRPASPTSGSEFTPPAESSIKRKRHCCDELAPQHAPDQEPGRAARDAFHGTPGGWGASEGRNYVLAGQLDTPSGECGFLGESTYSDSDYRRAFGSKRTREGLDMPSVDPNHLFSRPLPQSVTPSKSWSSFAVSTIGGVVGRVWQFCRAGSFRGFYAGGGSGYAVEPTRGDDEMFESDDETHKVPGQFPKGGYEARMADVDLGHDCEDSSRASTPSGPGAKRRQTGQVDDLGRNWVIVQDAQTGGNATRAPLRQSHKPLPRNRNQGPSMATRRRISTPPPPGRLSSTAPGSARRSSHFPPHPDDDADCPGPRSTSTASFAQPRSPSPSKGARPTSSQSTSTLLHKLGHSPHGRRTPVPHASHRRNQSGTSPASGREGGRAVDASPRLNAEAKQLAARRKREDRDADARIAAFNKQLRDMIREGKEALGTTVQIDGAEGAWQDED